MKPATGFFMLALMKAAASFFGGAADLADHEDGLGVGVVVEEPERVDEAGADDRVAADADAGRLADAELRELVHAS